MISHESQNVIEAGASANTAKGAIIMVHGRGASAESILELAAELDANDFALRAPQAMQNTWYPNSFLADIASNEPGITTGIDLLAKTVDGLNKAGIANDKIVFVGFSQGACLSSEFIARNAERWGGLIAFSGGIIGPKETPRNYPGDLEQTPVFLGCSDNDAHVPEWRVEESAQLFTKLGADVTSKIYPGMGHTINKDEIDHANAILDKIRA